MSANDSAISNGQWSGLVDAAGGGRSSLDPYRSGANDSFGEGKSAGLNGLPLCIGSRSVVRIVEAVARNCLAVTLWATLHIAANNVILPFDYTAVMTRAFIRAPII